MRGHLTSMADTSRETFRRRTWLERKKRWIAHALVPDILSEARADPWTLFSVPMIMALLPVFMVVGYAHNKLTDGFVPTAKSAVPSSRLLNQANCSQKLTPYGRL